MHVSNKQITVQQHHMFNPSVNFSRTHINQINRQRLWKLWGQNVFSIYKPFNVITLYVEIIETINMDEYNLIKHKYRSIPILKTFLNFVSKLDHYVSTKHESLEISISFLHLVIEFFESQFSVRFQVGCNMTRPDVTGIWIYDTNHFKVIFHVSGETSFFYLLSFLLKAFILY